MDRKINRLYKDTLFARLFGNAENKNAIIDLYNVLNGSDYDYDTDIQIVTIESTVYLGMHNDAAFQIENEVLNLWEEQSTYNPNMPLRGLIYLTQEYQGMFADGKKDIYGPAKIILPTPKYVVFYIGRKEEPNEWMKLSDAFVDPNGGCVEMVAKVVNISNPENGHILEACHLLKEYTYLVEAVNRNRENGMTLEEAVEAAVQECIDHDILKKFLLENREEMTDMILTEYNEKQHLENVASYYEEQGLKRGEALGEARGKEIGEAIGEARGEKNGRLAMLFSMVQSGYVSIDQAVKLASDLGVKSQEEFCEKAKAAGYHIEKVSSGE